MYKRIEQINAIDYNKIYVVGDIHGAFSELEKVLYAIQFDKERDLLVCVGDLVGRGVESEMAFKYLKKRWFKTVIGNHDLLFVEKEVGNSLIPVIDNIERELILNRDLKNKLIDAYRDSPLILEIVDGDDIVVITHAELRVEGFNNSYKEFKKQFLENPLSVKTLTELTWGRDVVLDLAAVHIENINMAGRRLKNPKIRSDDERDIFNNFKSDDDFKKYLHNRNIINDIKAAFHGHNIIMMNGLNKDNAHDLLRLGNQYFIDTGAFYKTEKYSFERNLLDGIPLGFTVFDVKTLKCVYCAKP